MVHTSKSRSHDSTNCKFTVEQINLLRETFAANLGHAIAGQGALNAMADRTEGMGTVGSDIALYIMNTTERSLLNEENDT